MCQCQEPGRAKLSPDLFDERRHGAVIGTALVALGHFARCVSALRDRRASGSYYTHDDLVGLIIRETISPFVVQRMEVFRAANEEQASSSKPEDQRLGILKRADPAEKLLDLKICDPAMGSGHFLAYAVIHALDRLAARDCLKRFSDRPARDPTSACHRVRVNRTGGQRARADRARIPKIGRILLDLVLDSF